MGEHGLRPPWIAAGLDEDHGERLSMGGHQDGHLATALKPLHELREVALAQLRPQPLHQFLQQANDRQGLERLCRYGARGALALERLSRAEDGRIRYCMKRPLPDGTPHLLFTGLELLRSVASLVPPPRTKPAHHEGLREPVTQGAGRDD